MPKPSYQRSAIEAALAGLPDESVVRQLVSEATVQDTLAAYEEADDKALAAQARYRAWGRRSLHATTFSILIGAMLLLPLDHITSGVPRNIIGALQTFAFIITLLAIAIVAWRRPLDQWRSHRAEAERLRGEIFAKIIDAVPTGSKAKALERSKLDLMVAAYAQDQIAFFDKRVADLRKSMSKLSPLRLVAYTLLMVGSLLGIGALAVNLSLPLHPWAERAVHFFKVDAIPRWQLGLATIASALLAFATARVLMDEDERRLELYKITAAKIRRVLKRDLETARFAADAGDTAPGRKLFADIRQILNQEHAVWSFVRDDGL